MTEFSTHFIKLLLYIATGKNDDRQCTCIGEEYESSTCMCSGSVLCMYDTIIGIIIYGLVHSIILRERALFCLGCEKWERYDLKALLRLVILY